MAEVINAKAILSNLSAGEKSCWRLVPTGITTADDGEFIATYAANLRDTKANAQYAADQFVDTLLKFALANKAVELEYLGARLTIEGSLKSMNEQPTPEKNPVRLKITIKGEAAKRLAELHVRNVTEMVEAALHEIMQEGASGLSRIENDQPITINGKGLNITADVDDEGVWIEKNGVIVKRGEVLFSSNAKIKVSFGALALDEGIYDLCVATRNGASASNGISARKLTRKVTIHV